MSSTKTKKNLFKKSLTKKQDKKSKKVRFTTNTTNIKLFHKNNVVTPNYKTRLVLPLDQIKIFKHAKTIEFLQKLEFDIWYDIKLKYPLLVAQPIDEKTFEQNHEVRRDLIGDSFTPDINSQVSKKETLSEADYKIYMEYGGSMGHNAPASYHKTSLDTYKETFLLSNVCPQEIVLNAGVWVLLETWCRDFFLRGQSKIRNLIVFTGSIKSRTTDTFKSHMKKGESVKMNVPTHMYKIIMYKTVDGKFTCFAFLFKNEPIYLRDGTKYYDMNKHIVSMDKLCNMANMSLDHLLNYYLQKFSIMEGLENNKVPKVGELFKIMKKKKFRFQINRYFTTQMGRSEYYGRLVYSKTIKELEEHWAVVKKRKEEFRNIDFHKEYYDMAKKRLEKLF